MEVEIMELSDVDVENLKKVHSGEKIDEDSFNWLVRCGVLVGTPLHPSVTETGAGFLKQ